MKGRILTAIFIAAISIIAIMSTASRSQNKTQGEDQNFSQHIEKVATKIFAQKKPNMLPIPESNQSTNSVFLEKLAGHINKEYGIREDILRYIEKEIPDNEMAKKA